MSRPRWYAKRAPITVSVEAGTQTHHVTWRAGRLVLHDHDLAAEEVLQALGGEPELCPCLLLRDALRGPTWGARPPGAPGVWPARAMWSHGVPVAWHTQLQVRAVGRAALSLTPLPAPAVRPGPRPAPPGAGLTAEQQAAAARQMLQRLQADPKVQRMPPEQRNRLLRRLRWQVAAQLLPESLREILALAEEVRAARQGQRAAAVQRAAAGRVKPPAEQRLQEAAGPVLEEAMRHARGHFRPEAAVHVGCWKQSPGEIPILQGDLTSRGGFVTLSLPVRWLNRVWLRGLACVDGSFVLDVDAPAPATELRGVAVRWEGRLGGHSVPVAAPCTIRRQAARWRLTW